MSLFTIIGSGFGLYGYLPSLVDYCSQQIVLPERYRNRFNDRAELTQYAENILWVADENAALNCADGAALALRPSDQEDYIPACLAHPKLNHLILEKPLARSPTKAAELFDELMHSRKTFRIGYNFRYTAWGKHLIHFLNSTTVNGVLSIRWNFLAHHFSHNLHNWKRYNSEGGGVIRFYGIHLIALLAELGYHDVVISSTFGESADELEKWTAVFTGSSLPKCEIEINSRSAFKDFHVEFQPNIGNKSNIVFADLSDPFCIDDDINQEEQKDSRIPILGQLCHSLLNNITNEYEWYNASISLWDSVEDKTRFEIISS